MPMLTTIFGITALIGLGVLSACGNGAHVSSGCDTSPDEDGDGLSDCRELELGTSPLVADTDGDGYSDFDEIVKKAFSSKIDNFQFNPRIADLPQLEIRLSSVPNISLVYSEEEGTATHVSTSHGSSMTEGIATTSGGSVSEAVEVSHTYSASVSVEASVTPSATVTVGYEYSHSSTSETSTNWSEEQSRENSRVFEESQELERSSGVSFSGGELSVTVTIANPGHIAYELSELTLTAYQVDARRPGVLAPVSTLTFLSRGNANVFPRTVVRPGETKEGFVFSAELDLDTARELLRDSRNLAIRPATYSLAAEGHTFGLETTEVNARTAEVILDLGADRPVESHRVALADLSDVTAAEVMDMLGVSFETGIGAWPGPGGKSPRPTERGLMRIGDVRMNGGEGSSFLVVSSRKAPGGAEPETRIYDLLDAGYDFETLPVRQGDVLHVVQTQDRDLDGLPERLERRLGTAPDKADSDGDGLSDLVEFVGWQTPCDSTKREWVYPDPTRVDSDADGIDDRSEWIRCSDPTSGVGEEARQ